MIVHVYSKKVEEVRSFGKILRKLVGSCENVFDEISYNSWSIKLCYSNQV